MKKQLLLGLCSSFFFLSGCGLQGLKEETSTSSTSSQTSTTTVERPISEQEQYEEAMQAAKKAMDQHDWREAILYLEKALQVKGEDKIAQNQRAQVQALQAALQTEKEGKYEEALTQWEQLIRQEGVTEAIATFATERQKAMEQVIIAQEKAVWNADKATQLKELMASWGQTMGQTYQEYTPENSVDYYGIKVPAVIFNGTFTMVVNEQPVSVEWSQNGLGTKDYQVVAVYSDAATQPYLEKHVYFFAFHEGQPFTFVTQQNQGNPYNYLYFHETQNVALRTGFLKIVEGR